MSLPLGGCIGSKIRVKDANLDDDFPSLHSVPARPMENDTDRYANYLMENENESNRIFKAPHRNASGCALASTNIASTNIAPTNAEINQTSKRDGKRVVEKRTPSPSYVQTIPNEIEPAEKPKQTKDYIQQNQEFRRKFGL